MDAINRNSAPKPTKKQWNELSVGFVDPDAWYNLKLDEDGNQEVLKQIVGSQWRMEATTYTLTYWSSTLNMNGQ